MFVSSKANARRIVVAVAAVTVLVALSACGTSASGPSTTNPPTVSPATASTAASNADPHNAQDVGFLQMMIPHHEQAVQMAQMVPSRSQNAKILALAAAIKSAQGPEIAQMQSWLTDWGVSVSPSSTADMSGMAGMDSGSSGVPADGMMTADQMAALAKSSGAAFDKMWLQMMIEHHEGAVVMARHELAAGQNAQVKALAQAVIDGQTKEVNEMKLMLNS